MTNIVDPAVVAALTQQLGAEFVGEIIELYLGELPGRVVAIGDALRAGDDAAAAAAAHALRSASAMLGAEAIAARCHEIEQACDQGRTPPDEDLVTVAQRTGEQLAALR